MKVRTGMIALTAVALLAGMALSAQAAGGDKSRARSRRRDESCLQNGAGSCGRLCDGSRARQRDGSCGGGQQQRDRDRKRDGSCQD